MLVFNSMLPEMHKMPFSQLLLSILLTLSIAHLTTSQQQCSSKTTAQVRAGFWLSQSNHYSPVSSINTSLYTHLYYYSLSVDAKSGVALPVEGQVNLLNTFSNALKSSNPSLKTLLSIATDDHQSNASNAAFSLMAGNPDLRATFISSAIQLARANEFDGLDVEWHYPSSPLDMANFGILLTEWRAQINQEAQNSQAQLLLTATVHFSDHIFDGPVDNLDYPIDAIANNVDWINALCFGYHKNANVTTADAALYDQTSHFSTSYGVTSWMDAGMPPCKLLMGIPLYGRSWLLKNKLKNGFGAQVVAAGPRQKLSNQTGLMAYFEIKELLKETDAAYLFENHTVSSYLHAGDIWVSFDSQEVVEEKIIFALQNTLLGYFLWPISFDDNSNTISRQAMEVLLRDYAFIDEIGENGLEEGSSPIELSPQDQGPPQSASSSGQLQSFPVIEMLHFNSYLPFLLLYWITTI